MKSDSLFLGTNSNKKNPKVITFEPLKIGKTETGVEYIFCKTNGMGIREGIFIEKKMLDKLEIDTKSLFLKIATDKFIVEKTVSGDFYKFYLRVPAKMWFQIKSLKKELEDGIDWETLKEVAKKGNLELKEIKSSRYGSFISILPNDLYSINQEHKINIYPGNSVKNSGSKNTSLIQYIDKNQDRITFKSFSKGGKVYYRFYLRKVKNSYKKNEED
ncbi:MAG: hypothetical protein P1U70_26215 [Saprospiraceae bacterium]|jgi:hypothetical protein|nr:hypothetical protein [Saprospiraceae bacterium]